MSDARNQVPVVLMIQVDELERLYPGDMVRGYLDGFDGAPWPDKDPSPAYEHGRRNGINDKAGTVDPEQALLARDYLKTERLNAALKEMGAASLSPSHTLGGE